MKSLKHILSRGALLGALLLGSLAAHAVTVDATYLFGKSDDGAPSGLGDEPQRLTFLIKQYNTSGASGPTVGTFGDLYTTYTPANVPAAPLPAYDGNSTGQVGAAATSLSIDVTGWTYLLVKWASNDYFYYVGDLTGVVTVNNDVQFNPGNGRPQNASHYRLFNDDPGTRVPDGGTTVALLGLGMLGVAAARRRA